MLLAAFLVETDPPALAVGASKGFLTTTSDFAPRLRSAPLIAPWIPSRIELINGTALFSRLAELAAGQKKT
jgi:hypothetical protein